jgi:hypothetical protein
MHLGLCFTRDINSVKLLVYNGNTTEHTLFCTHPSVQLQSVTFEFQEKRDQHLLLYKWVYLHEKMMTSDISLTNCTTCNKK